MSEGYLVVKCYRCGSTMQLVTSGVRSEVFQCPVCQEGEIDCRAQGYREIINDLRNSDRYIAAPVKLSAN